MDLPAQFIRINVEALLTFGVGAFLAAVSAAWALLFQLVFKPLNALKTEISRANDELHKLAIKQLEIESQHNGRMNIFEVTTRGTEQKVSAIEHRSEQLRISLEDRMRHIDDKISKVQSRRSISHDS